MLENGHSQPWVLYNTLMRYSLLPAFGLLLAFLLAACAPAPSQGARFFYLKMEAVPTLVLLDSPDSAQPLSQIALASPPNCGFWSLTPAPRGPLAALEWQCPFGLLTQIVNTADGTISPLLTDDTNTDAHFLTWSNDGNTVYARVGATTNPRILRVDARSHQGTEMSQVSPNTYNFTVSPSDGVLLWAFTNGIGFGSEVWGSAPDGTSPQMVLSDAQHIIGLIRYSPDGKYVAAIRQPDGQEQFPPGQLWLADADGKHPHAVATTDAGRGMFPVWSPDGQKIAFIGRTRPHDPTSINLSILNISDSHLSTLNFQPSTPPSWSPNGSHLYFTLAADGKMELWFYEISTEKSAKLFDNACCAGWVGK